VLSPSRCTTAAFAHLASATIVAVALSTSCGPRTQPTAGEVLTTVVRVIDGDTVVVSIAGSAHTVRLIGIDTPEIAHHDQPGECFGPEAAERTRALLPPGSPVVLHLDAETRDRYGRLLAYVRIGDVLVNAALVEDGFATTLPIAPNTALRDRLAVAENDARRAGRGLWGACQ
jgi:micrococcal nuclease